MNPIHSADWANFFVAEVGASAALTGLVVVAISINLSRILSILHLPGRAGEALVILAGALVVTSVALVPNQPAVIFGIESLVIGLVTFLVPLAMQLRSFTASGIPPARQYFRVALSAGASLPIVVAGLLLMLGSSAGLYWIAAGVILSLMVGIFSAWVLLIEIMR